MKNNFLSKIILTMIFILLFTILAINFYNYSVKTSRKIYKSPVKICKTL